MTLRVFTSNTGHYFANGVIFEGYVDGSGIYSMFRKFDAHALILLQHRRAISRT